MPSRPDKTIQVEYTLEFKRNLRGLTKKYRHIRFDIQPIIEQLQRGEIIGNQIHGIHQTIFKVKIKNRDIQKGKSSGYRLIYHLKTSTNIVIITIYSKLEQGDISADRIRYIVKEFESSRLG